MKIIKLLSFLLAAVCLASCTLTENIYMNEDGSGKFTLDMDGSALLAMVPKDSLANEKKIDSTFTFKELLASKKDSISKLPKAEQDQLKKMENFSVKMKMDFEEKAFLIGMTTDFKSVAELQDAMTAMNALQAMNKQKSENGAAAPGGFSNNSTLNYTYDGKKFTRKAILGKKAEKPAEDASAEGYKMIYESSSYVIKYHFPKRVKSVSNETAQFSEDRKTITIEYPFNEYMDHPEKLNFDVVFE